MLFGAEIIQKLNLYLLHSGHGTKTQHIWKKFLSRLGPFNCIVSILYEAGGSGISSQGI